MVDQTGVQWVVLLFLTQPEIGYRIFRGGNAANAAISVVGDEITISGSSRCDGVGTYPWLIEEGSLTFIAAEPSDPCDGRRPVLGGVTCSR